MKLLKYVLALLSVVSCFAPIAGRSAAAPGTAADSATAPAKPKPSADLFGDSVVARGKGFEIKRSQLDD
jgi:hypothetical protein